MHLGLGVLRLAPADFWRTTPRELAAAFEPALTPGLTRQTLDALMTRFPDDM